MIWKTPEVVAEAMEPGYQWGSSDCINFAQGLLEHWTGDEWPLRPEWATGSYAQAMKAAGDLAQAYDEGLLAARSATGDRLLKVQDPRFSRSLFVLKPGAAGRTYLVGLRNSNGRRMSDKHPPLLGQWLGTDGLGWRYGAVMTTEGLTRVKGYTLSLDWYTPASVYKAHNEYFASLRKGKDA